jgi:hypothetical protein
MMRGNEKEFKEENIKGLALTKAKLRIHPAVNNLLTQQLTTSNKHYSINSLVKMGPIAIDQEYMRI